MASSFLPVDTNIVLFLVTVVSAIVAIIMFNKYANVRANSPIGVVEAQCKDSGNPMIKVVDPTGKFEVYEGITKETRDVAFKKPGVRGLQVRPDLLNKVECEWTPARVPMYSYDTDFHFVTNSKAGRALVTSVEYVRKKYPQLSFITDDLEIIEAIFTDADALEDDCRTFLKAYEQDTEKTVKVVTETGEEVLTTENPERLTAEELKDIFEEMKKDIPNIPLKKGYVSMKQAMSLIPEGTTAQEMARYGDEILKGERMNNGEDYKKLMMWVAAASIPLGIVAIVFLAAKVM